MGKEARETAFHTTTPSIILFNHSQRKPKFPIEEHNCMFVDDFALLTLAPL